MLTTHLAFSTRLGVHINCVVAFFVQHTVRSVFLGGCLHLALRWRDFCHHKPVFDRSFFDVRVAPDAICVETFDNLVWLRVLSLHRV